MSNAVEEWQWDFISRAIDIRAVIDHPDRTWNREWLSMNKEITIDLIDNLELPNAVDDEWCWRFISQYIDIKEVYDHPDRPWDKDGLSRNKGITIDLIDNLVMSNVVEEWNWDLLQERCPITDYIRYPDKKWSKEVLSRNPNIKILYIDIIDPPPRSISKPYRINKSIHLSDISIVT
jgi:hypothetical protein